MSMIGNLKQISSSQLETIKKDPSIVESIIYQEQEETAEELCIDKTWQGIHFLLTGKAEGGASPLADTIMGGEEIGNDLGYGPARYLTPSEVKEVSGALSKISKEDFGKRFDPKALLKADIYPSAWDEVDRDYLLDCFEKVVEYYKGAAGKGNAMLIYIN